MLLSALLLCACGNGSGSSISAEELLERAAAENQRLQSADLTMELTMQGGQEAGQEPVHFTSQGSMQEGGKLISLSGTIETESSGQALRLTGDVVLRNGNEIYLRVADVDVNVGIGYVRLERPELQGFLDRWWLLPTDRAAQNNDHADPALLPMQIEALDVVSDEGTTEQNGHPVRELTVRVNDNKMQELLDRVSSQRGEESDGTASSFLQSYDAEGTVWIEEDTALLRTIRWNLTPKDGSSATVELDINLLNPNAGKEIALPQGALPLVPGMSPVSIFMQNIPNSASPQQ